MTADTNKDLTDWLQAYHDSVGSSADECMELYDSLRQSKLANGNNLSLMRELLEVMSALSPDPHTVSCAMLLVTPLSRPASGFGRHWFCGVAS